MTTEVVTLTELSGRVGVDVDLLKRMIRTGALPEAAKVSAPDGPTWVVPAGMVDQLVNRHGWTVTAVDLTDGGPAVTVTEAGPQDHFARRIERRAGAGASTGARP